MLANRTLYLRRSQRVVGEKRFAAGALNDLLSLVNCVADGALHQWGTHWVITDESPPFLFWSTEMQGRPNRSLKRLQCKQCRTLIGYDPMGSPLVQCSICNTINQGEQVVQCVGCKSLLTYNPLGSPQVQCAICQHVTNVPQRFQCHQCHQLVTAAPGAKSARCTNCGTTLNAASSGGGATQLKAPGPSNVPHRPTLEGSEKTDDTPAKTEEEQCVVCLDNKKVVLIYPCGHMCVCIRCSTKVKDCPVCRKKVDDVIKVFA